MSYVIVSDIHGHAWSLFNKPDPSGMNGRLKIILDELERAADHAISINANFIVIAGDILHVRGSINPEVLNPLQAAIKRILDRGLNIYAIPGNHDLAGKETDELGNAILTLSQTKSAHGELIVIDKPIMIDVGDHKLGFVPWCSKPEDLIACLQILAAKKDHQLADVFIHAGIDGVLPALKGHGITDDVLAQFGFRNVFAGHYHHHKSFGRGIWSIGATTHQTWGDLGSDAGFLSVDDSGNITFHRSHAPHFIDVSDLTEEDMQLASDGNYVRFSSANLTVAEIDEIREQFVKWGAKGVSILAPKAAAAQTRRANAPKAGASLDESVTAFVDARTDIPTHIDRDKIKSMSIDVLNKVREVREEA